MMYLLVLDVDFVLLKWDLIKKKKENIPEKKNLKGFYYSVGRFLYLEYFLQNQQGF